MIDSFFVYGTLKRIRSRAGLWPAKPISITTAWVYGELYDCVDYPAMVKGKDRVVGELWKFESSDLKLVVNTIDKVEGYQQPGHVDLYHRVQVPVFGLQGWPEGLAFTYHYACHPDLDGFDRLKANEAGFVGWP